jgi:hypothetical protein
MDAKRDKTRRLQTRRVEGPLKAKNRLKIHRSITYVIHKSLALTVNIHKSVNHKNITMLSLKRRSAKCGWEAEI